MLIALIFGGLSDFCFLSDVFWLDYSEIKIFTSEICEINLKSVQFTEYKKRGKT